MDEDDNNEVTEIKAAHFKESMKFAVGVLVMLIYSNTRHLLRPCSSLGVLEVNLGSLRHILGPALNLIHL